METSKKSLERKELKEDKEHEDVTDSDSRETGRQMCTKIDLDYVRLRET